MKIRNLLKLIKIINNINRDNFINLSYNLKLVTTELANYYNNTVSHRIILYCM